MGDTPETTCSTMDFDVNRFRNCVNIPNRQTEKLNEQIERNRDFEEENKILKEIIKQKDHEIAKLSQKQLSKEARLTSLEEWMRRQIEELRLSWDKLNENTMEVYKIILEKGVAKAQSTTISDRRKLSEEIQKLENLCEEVGNDVMENNEESMRKYMTLKVEIQKDLHEKTVSAQARLALLIEKANELLQDADGVPSEYESTAQELLDEIKHSREILSASKSDKPTVNSLRHALDAAAQLAPVLSDRATAWKQFVMARNDADAALDELRRPLEAVLSKTLRNFVEVQSDLAEVTKGSNTSNILAEKIRDLQKLSELLDPLESCYADVRFFDVDAEQTEKQYDELMNELSSEIDTEKVLRESAEYINNKIETLKATFIETPTLSAIKAIETNQLPALRAQIQVLQEKSSEALDARKHVAADASLLSTLEKTVNDLEKRIAETKAAAEKNAE